jgi:hypothetical protein
MTKILHLLVTLKILFGISKVMKIGIIVSRINKKLEK